MPKANDAPLHGLASTRRPIRSGVWIAVCLCGRESPGRTKRANAIREIEHHATEADTKPVPAECPTRSARRFRKQETAEADLGRRWKGVRPGQLKAHTYLCRCGYWHHTKRDIR